MMRKLSFLLVAALSLTGCVRDNTYYEPQPSYFQDEFVDNRNNWEFESPQNNAAVYISGGQLHYVYYPSNPGSNTVAITTGARFTNTWRISTRMKNNNYGGLAFGVSPQTYGYSFLIDAIDRKFAVYKEGDANNGPQTLINWTASSAISSSWNKLEIQSQNGQWTGYVNDTQVFTMSAQPLTGDQVGFEVLENTTADADYLSVEWY